MENAKLEGRKYHAHRPAISKTDPSVADRGTKMSLQVWTLTFPIEEHSDFQWVSDS